MGLGASELAGLLADIRRRRVVAALVLGATTRAEARARSGITAREFVTALNRLVDAGLVIDDGATITLDETAFRAAARRPKRGAAVGEEPVDRVLVAFVEGKRLRSIPVNRTKRRAVLELLAQDFEPGIRYSERAVNLALGQWHADVASLRRYLVDEGFLDRAEGQYWRSGGAVPV